MTDVNIDLETMPQQPEAEARAAIAETIEAPSRMSKPETIAEWHSGGGKYAGEKEAEIDEKYRRTALDGSKGQIMSIAWSVGDSEETHCIITGEAYDEPRLISTVYEGIKAELGQQLPFFVGHFVGGFDLPFLFQRSVINRVQPPFDLGQHGRHGQHFYDTMTAWAGWKGTISLDNLCAALGIEVDSPEAWTAARSGMRTRLAGWMKSCSTTRRT